jgi:hypothetical protein
MSATDGHRGLLMSGFAALAMAAGCGAPPGSADRPGAPPTARVQDPLPVVHRGVAGGEGGLVTMRPDDYDALFDDGYYFGVKYTHDLGLNLAYCLSVGYSRMDSKIPGGDELERYPLRLTIQFGAYLGPTQSRWYVGGGGGYNLMDDDYPTDDMVEDWPVDVPLLMDEYTAHAVFGLEFRNRSFLTTGVEAGHTWMLDSGADIWTVTGSLSYQF